MILGMDEYEKQFEQDMQKGCQAYAMYESHERTTLDREWTESELEADIYDICLEVMTEQELKKYQHRALKDTDLLKVQYMAEHINSKIDVVSIYNEEYAKNNPHNEKVFGINFYDNALKKMILQELKDNLINK